MFVQLTHDAEKGRSLRKEVPHGRENCNRLFDVFANKGTNLKCSKGPPVPATNETARKMQLFQNFFFRLLLSSLMPTTAYP